MPSKKKMEFNNIVKEFGFPTSIRNIENTYKSDCFFEGSKLWFEVKDFEREFNEEIERQNNTTISKPDKEQASERYYRFQEIFLKHEKIFDPELYLLQMNAPASFLYFSTASLSPRSHSNFSLKLSTFPLWNVTPLSSTTSLHSSISLTKQQFP